MYICKEGFTIIYDICQSQCGDGIVVATEQCDDRNLINHDGCDDDCLPSKNSLCKNQDCIVINPPLAKLTYMYKKQGEQFVVFQYNQIMRIADEKSVEDYLSSLVFKFQVEQDNVSEFTILDSKENINQQITIKIKFLQRLDTPKLILNITATGLLINENNISVEESIYILNLQQPNILSFEQQESVQSFVKLSEQNLIFDTIQQLYYLKYLNCRIGENLGQFLKLLKLYS